MSDLCAWACAIHVLVLVPLSCRVHFLGTYVHDPVYHVIVKLIV